jgi:hypothetical protein
MKGPSSNVIAIVPGTVHRVITVAGPERFWRRGLVLEAAMGTADTSAVVKIAAAIAKRTKEGILIVEEIFAEKVRGRGKMV